MSKKALQWMKNAESHAIKEYPKESCGLVVKGKYLPCANQAKSGEHFMLSGKDYAKAEDSGKIQALVHSHPDESANPSEADRVACEKSNLPWHIIGLSQGSISGHGFCKPEGYQAPLVGRQFYHGVLDCYTLVQDWYEQEKGIILPDFERHDEWWNHGENLYIDNFQKARFISNNKEDVANQLVPADAKIGDVILMQIISPVPNHAAIWLGDDKILHHLYNRLSGRDVYGGYWRKHTTHWLRYTG